MAKALTRRDLVITSPALGLAAGILTGLPSSVAHAGPLSDSAMSALWPGFPRMDAKLVSEVVGKSHFDETRVKELVKAHPSLVNASWDWGFGDFETALGAASHTGQRGIAEFLLERGARIDIFAAAMLGNTAVVKAFVTTQSGIQRTLGPHGITLLSHAKAGGKPAADTVAYLVSLGDADIGHPVAPVPADRKEAFLGKFESAETGVRMECRFNKAGKLMVEIQHAQTEPVTRLLLHHGEDEFFTPGIPGVRLKFVIEGGKAKSLSIRGTDLDLSAKRVGV